MKRLMAFFKSEYFQIKVKPEVKRFLAVVIFTMIYGIGVKWFLEQAAIRMYTGGIPGIAQLLRDVFTHKLQIKLPMSEDIFMAIIIITFNIPILILGWIGVSKRFTIYSLISVIIQATFIGLIPKVDLGLSAIDHELTVAILGGLLVGVGAGGALRYGTSTGGLDILAQYFSFKKGQTVGAFSMAMNVAIAVIGGFVLGGSTGVDGKPVLAGTVAAYTIMRIIVSTIVTDRIHTSYQHLSVEIVTGKPEEVCDIIIHKIYRGATLIECEGAYSHQKKMMLVVAVLSYELNQVVELVKKADPHAFIVAKPVRRIIGNFKRKTIA